MPNWNKGAQGAATGAAAGTAILPGWGTVIGAGIGGIAGLFTPNRRPAANPATDMLRQQVANMTQQTQDLAGRSPSSTAFYSSGQGELRDFLRQMTQSDARMAASRGMAGGEMEIAQAGRRQGLAAEQQRRLLTASEQQLEAQRQASLARLMQALGMYGQLAGSDQNRSDQQQQSMYASLLPALATILGPRPTTQATA